MKKILIILIAIYVINGIYGETINDNHVRLRKYPFLNMEILSNLNTGETVEVLLRSDFKEKIYNTENYWYQVSFNNTVGWVYGEFINGLHNENYYRVANFEKSRINKIIDYDFEQNKFIDLKNSEEFNIRELNIPYVQNKEIACWFDPIEIRSFDGYDGTSTLHIKSQKKEIVLYGERTNYYYEECSFMKLSPNNKYLIVDQGTGHLRGIAIYSTDTGHLVASGSYTHNIEYNRGNEITFFCYSNLITADKDKAIDYIISNNVADINGNNYQVGSFKKEIEDAPDYASFYFGNLYSFNFETGQKSSKGNILYYIDIE